MKVPHNSMPAVLTIVALAAAALGSGSLWAAAPPGDATTAAFALPGPAVATAATGQSRDYVLGAGDIIHITVFQNPDLTVDTRVSESGDINYPLIGTVKIGGLTISQAEHAIAARLQHDNFVRNPQVNILPTQIVGSQVAVLGQVNKPGRYPLTTLDTRVSDMLAIAGGIAPDGADSVWLIGRRDGRVTRQRLSTAALFIRGSEPDEVVHAGDVLYVAREPMIYIYGQVQKPGAYRLANNMTVMQGLAEGGGLTAKGTERGIRIHRRLPDGRIVEITPRLDDPLQPGDVIYVRASVF